MSELKVGDRVRINETCPYSEWHGVHTVIVGMRLNRDGTMNIHCSQDWPRDVGEDGWQVFNLDLLPDQRPTPEPAAEASAEDVAACLDAGFRVVETTDEVGDLNGFEAVADLDAFRTALRQRGLKVVRQS